MNACCLVLEAVLLLSIQSVSVAPTGGSCSGAVVCGVACSTLTATAD
jgi:hypothetical protein